MFEYFARLHDRVERLPPLARYAASGAFAIWFLIGVRGGLIAIPILSIVLLARSSAPLADFIVIVAVFALATLGGAAGGLSYGLLGRRLLKWPLGPYLAGWVTVLPYFAFIFAIVRLASPTSFEGLSAGDLLGGLGFMTLIFGSLLGFVLFRKDGTAA